MFSFLKCLVIGLIALEALYPFEASGNFNGDKAKRPYLHGAYEVRRMISNGDTTESSIVKRLFIHRDDYMIFQDSQDNMRDYKFTYDRERNEYTLYPYEGNARRFSLTYHEGDSILLVKFNDITGST